MKNKFVSFLLLLVITGGAGFVLPSFQEVKAQNIPGLGGGIPGVGGNIPGLGGGLPIPALDAGAACGILNMAGALVPGMFGQVVQIVCGQLGGTAAVQVQAGNGNPNHFIWHTGYFTRDGATWEPIELTGATPANGDTNWKAGTAGVNLPLLPDESKETNFVAVYQCENINDAWKCGCTTNIESCTDKGEYTIIPFVYPSQK